MNESNIAMQDVRQFVCFMLAGEEYGIPILRVQEIIRYSTLTRIPQSADFVEGVLNLRGRVIPVIDLRKRFNIPENQMDESKRIVVVEIDKRIIGLIVDSVTEVRSIDDDQVSPPPHMGTAVNSDFISGMGQVEERLIMLLNLDSAFSEEEKECLANAGE